MTTEDKEIVLNLVSRLPANATLLDLAREVEALALAHAGRVASASGWLVGQSCRDELHRVARERAVRFVVRMLSVFSHGRN